MFFSFKLLPRKNNIRRKNISLKEKFKNKELRDSLISTGDIIIKEHNTWGDKFWGIYGGEGENHLGKILMKIRKEVKESKGE